MSSQNVLIAPSILAADSLNLQNELKEIESLGADFHHIDVMDGHFVPNLSFGLPLIKAIKKISSIPLDVHIMISNPDEMAIEYVKSGADYLVFHVEATNHAHRLTQVIKGLGAKPGIAINPQTPLNSITEMLEYVSIVNIMTVNPGFGGQKFITSALHKISDLKDLLIQKNLDKNVFIEVDGGVDKNTVSSVVEAGANLLVAGSFIYGNSDRKKAFQILRSSN